MRSFFFCCIFMLGSGDLLPEPVQLTSHSPRQWQYVCQDQFCKHGFVSPSNLARHYNITGHGAAVRAKANNSRTVIKRTRRTNTRKRDTLDELDRLRQDPSIAFPLTYLVKTTGISKSLISTWDNHERVAIYDAAAASGGAGKHSTALGQRTSTFPLAEELLYGRFLFTRQVDQLPVTHEWLQEEMLDIVTRLNPDAKSDAYVSTFKASNGWSSGFTRRWAITSQSVTNNHTTPIAERVPDIKKFHQFLIYEMQGRLPQRFPVYGHFPPDCIFHLDQVPLPFAPPNQRTLHAKGTQCTIKQPGGSGATKRFCSLQICICAHAGKQIVNIEIYFKGKGHVTKEELDFYNTLDNITIRFNDKAWSDEATAMEALVDFRKQTLHLGEVLLGMDGHKAQITPYLRAFMDHMGIRYAITTPNCTDIISPVDRHVGKAIKDKIKVSYNNAHKTNKRLWVRPESEGGLSAARKRMLVATWTAKAWADFMRDNQYCIERAFVETGFLLAADGSDRLEVRPYKNPKAKKRGRKRTADEKSFMNMSPEGISYDFGPPTKMVKR